MQKQLGILIIHGFGGNIEEIKPLQDFLESKGYPTYAPVLKGHTGKRKDLQKVSYEEWIISAEKGLIKLQTNYSKVMLIGFSMGGLIAIHLALKHSVQAVITLNTPIYYWNIKNICKNILQDLRNKDYTVIREYLKSTTKFPLGALINFRLILHKTKPLFKEVYTPLFIAQAINDDTVHYKSGNYIYAACPHENKVIHNYANSRHLICHSQDAPKLFQDILAFIEKLK